MIFKELEYHPKLSCEHFLSVFQFPFNSTTLSSLQCSLSRLTGTLFLQRHIVFNSVHLQCIKVTAEISETNTKHGKSNQNYIYLLYVHTLSSTLKLHKMHFSHNMLHIWLLSVNIYKKQFHWLAQLHNDEPAEVSDCAAICDTNCPPPQTRSERVHIFIWGSSGCHLRHHMVTGQLLLSNYWYSVLSNIICIFSSVANHH